jgi:hypothetical protein
MLKAARSFPAESLKVTTLDAPMTVNLTRPLPAEAARLKTATSGLSTSKNTGRPAFEVPTRQPVESNVARTFLRCVAKHERLRLHGFQSRYSRLPHHPDGGESDEPARDRPFQATVRPLQVVETPSERDGLKGLHVRFSSAG